MSATFCVYILINDISIPFEIHPKGSDPATCSYKPRGLAKSLQNEWMGASRNLSIQNGRALCINQLFAAPPHSVGRYILPGMFDFYLFLSMSSACVLGPWSPKKASFCNNLLLCHFPAFFSMVFKEQPILFVRKWAQWYVRPVFLQSKKQQKKHGAQRALKVCSHQPKSLQSMNSLQNDH